jgi:hypothetical protein
LAAASEIEADLDGVTNGARPAEVVGQNVTPRIDGEVVGQGEDATVVVELGSHGVHRRTYRPGVVAFFTEDRPCVKHNGHSVDAADECPACDPVRYSRVQARHRRIIEAA